MIDASNFRKVFNRARSKATITNNLTPNSCRHTAASFAVHHGATVYSVQRMMGHSKPSITLDVYGSLFDESQQALADKLDAAIRASKANVATPDAQVIELHSNEN